MDNIRRNKLWVGLLAISIILSSSGLIHSTSNTAYANGIGAPNTLAAPNKENKRRAFPIIDEAATILGLQTDNIKTALAQGKSLVDLAKEQGLSEVDFTNRLLALRVLKVDEDVKSGKIPQEKADHVKAKMQQHITFMINSKNLLEMQTKDHKNQFKHEAKQMMSPQKLAAIIGISEDKLVEQLKAGKSITEIAEAHGINKEQLVAKIKENLTPFLERAVDHKNKTK